MEPWGLSEPKFLALYLTALPVALSWASAVRSTLWRPNQPADSRPLDLLELAFLAGGVRRVAEVLVARQLDAGAMRLAAGVLVPVPPPTTATGVDELVARAVPTHGRPLARVLAEVGRSPAVDALGARLVRAGYAVDPHAVGRARAVAVLPLLLLAAVGLVRWCTGLVSGEPIDWDTGLVGLTLLAAVWVRRRRPPTRTAAGDRVLRAARRAVWEPTTDDGTPLAGFDPAVVRVAGPAGVVALDGLAAHPDHPRDPSGDGSGTAGWPPGWWRGDSVTGSNSHGVV
ncbi:TIGR04222 domain-containing membrane protein [Streptoalloteichus hindustanus]|uniref:MYXO-CTERM domain-containing protein/TIGR04222 domain-containing protein n=1 Tax=Streptoalloteichus hindustanus TaxID=2017 RepID=A0A1M5H584_STRHI|nr:TIGR04222 domain-containing membrane protein [Streptoalloteichus hindustanus]SHG11160.1 MYXO-CTERM domain-containing protein/TIGR04222 domain-containing protein [Streptoalloteichus hindustanus]